MQRQQTSSTAFEPANIRPILNRTFRANPDYELIPFDRLPTEQQDLFANLRRDPDFFGILRPQPGVALPLKSACRDTAVLFTALQAADRLPSFVLDGEPSETNRAIAKLVMDGVFELEVNGRMVHGPEALADIGEVSELGAPASEIARLSQDALRYGQSLPIQDAGALSGRLYSYGRIPMSATWKRKYPDEEAVRRSVGLDQDDENSRRLAEHWHALPPDPENDGWIGFQSRRARASGSVMYKLYVSPRPEFLRTAFHAAVPILSAEGASGFKIGKDLSGILRPDKFVAYFSEFERVQQAAERIVEELSGCPTHGVPFTAEFGTPLVSWGIDPPAEDDAPAWLSRQSWRVWVATRLAVALIAGRQNDSSSIEPWRFAIERVRLEGVDTNTWTPVQKEQK